MSKHSEPIEDQAEDQTKDLSDIDTPVEIICDNCESGVSIDVNATPKKTSVKVDSSATMHINTHDRSLEVEGAEKNKPASLNQFDDKISTIQVERSTVQPNLLKKILNTFPGVRIDESPPPPPPPEKTMTEVPIVTDYKDVPSYALIGLDKNRQPALIWTSPLINKGETVLERKSIIYKMVFLIIAPVVILLWLTNVVGLTTYFNVKFDTGFSASLTVLVMSLISSFTGSAIGQAKIQQDNASKNDNKYIQYYFIDFSGDNPQVISRTAEFILTPPASEKSLVSQIALGILSLALTFFWIIGGTNAFSFWTGQDLTSDKAEFSTLTNVFLLIISLVAGLASSAADKK